MSNFKEWSDIDIRFRKSLSGEIAIVRGEEAINQSIKIILSTIQGERVRSDMGSSLFGVLFNPMSVDSAEEIQSIIETNITRYEERVFLNRVEVRPNFDQNFYTISIDYSIKPSRTKKNLTTFMQPLGDF